MKFVLASDSLKGTISSSAAADLLKSAAQNVFPHAECVCLPIADGGEGSVDAILASVNGRKEHVRVHGPLGDMIDSFYGTINNSAAFIEMAAASGLCLIEKERYNPLLTSTYGTGELIDDAVNKGFKHIYITLGGSATNDGGIGCLQALGFKFLDSTGKELKGMGVNLQSISKVISSGFESRLKDVEFTLLCDVDNPLCGCRGATCVFGPQKGADAGMCELLEHGMCHWRDVMKDMTGIDADTIPGAGAAGGLGAALNIFLGARIQSGIESILDFIGFEEHLRGADLVITGEGRADSQSVHGKVLSGIGRRCKAAGVPAIALVGSVENGLESLAEIGIERIYSVSGPQCTLEESLSNPESTYLRAAEEMFLSLK